MNTDYIAIIACFLNNFGSELEELKLTSVQKPRVDNRYKKVILAGITLASKNTIEIKLWWYGLSGAFFNLEIELDKVREFSADGARIALVLDDSSDAFIAKFGF